MERFMKCSQTVLRGGGSLKYLAGDSWQYGNVMVLCKCKRGICFYSMTFAKQLR